MTIMGAATVNGVEISYEVSGEGPPLVLVHAGIADSRMWNDQVPAFTEYHRVIRYDLRGYGRTKPVAGDFSHYQDLHGLLQYLGVEQTALIGCSIGGAAAIDFVLAYPEMVNKLVLVGSGLAGFDPEVDPPSQWDEVVTAWDAGDIARTAELDVQIWVDGPKRTPDQVESVIRDRIREMDVVALTNEASGLGKACDLEPFAADRLSEIQVPTLVIVGDLDQPDILLISDKLAADIPNVQKTIMEGTAHVPNMERPQEFNQIVLDFLRNDQ